MEKRMASQFGVHKKPMKRRRKKHQTLKKVVDYLKSDSYLFAPLFSDFSPGKNQISATPTGADTVKPFVEKNEKQLIKKIADYFISDSYMYAPLLIPQPSQKNQTTPHSAPVQSPGKISTAAQKEREAATNKTKLPGKQMEHAIRDNEDLDGCPPVRRTVIRRTLVHQEKVKHVVHQNCRSSSVLGALTTESRNLAVE